MFTCTEHQPAFASSSESAWFINSSVGSQKVARPWRRGCQSLLLVAMIVRAQTIPQMNHERSSSGRWLIEAWMSIVHYIWMYGCEFQDDETPMTDLPSNKRNEITSLIDRQTEISQMGKAMITICLGLPRYLHSLMQFGNENNCLTLSTSARPQLDLYWEERSPYRSTAPGCKIYDA